jgi:penicillin amidase
MYWAPGYRAQRIVDLLEADPSLSIEDFQRIHGDNNPLWAQEVLPYVRGLSSAEPRLAKALDLLRTWDGRAVRDSSGAVLFEAFRLHVVDAILGDELGNELLPQARPAVMTAMPKLLAEPESPWFDDQTTPHIETRDEILLLALEGAVEELSETLGPDLTRWRWADLHTATFVNQSLGQSGIGPVEALFNRGPVPADGTIATVNNTSYRPSQPYGVASVPSYRQIVDLADLARSISMHTTGQSGHPFHVHYDDMIDPWRNIEYHPMLWTQADVEADAEGVLVLKP